MSSPYQAACSNGNLELLQWMIDYNRENGRSSPEIKKYFTEMFLTGIVGGHVHLLDWIWSKDQSVSYLISAGIGFHLYFRVKCSLRE